MSIERGAGRYAPSPSGEQHLGNLRTAILAWLFARKSGRSFLIRIEDLDRERDRGAANQQLEDLQDMGIDWDAPPIRQTDRSAAYEDVIAQLARAGSIYECICTRKEIAEAPSAPHGLPGLYPGTCRGRSSAEQDIDRNAIYPRLPAWRLRVPDELRHIEFVDQQLGSVRGYVDDFVLRRGDGAIAYNLAVVIDDAYSGIDQIVRGDDLAPSTPRQIALQQLLSLPTPQYAHVPLVLGPTGARLAKRDGAVTLNQLKQAGWSPAEVRSALAQSLGFAAPGEPVTIDQLLERFVPEEVPRSPWVFKAINLVDRSG